VVRIRIEYDVVAISQPIVDVVVVVGSDLEEEAIELKSFRVAAVQSGYEERLKAI